MISDYDATTVKLKALHNRLLGATHQLRKQERYWHDYLSDKDVRLETSIRRASAILKPMLLRRRKDKYATTTRYC